MSNERFRDTPSLVLIKDQDDENLRIVFAILPYVKNYKNQLHTKSKHITTKSISCLFLFVKESDLFPAPLSPKT